MTSKLKLKRKKFHQPYRDVSIEAKSDDIQTMEYVTNKNKMLKNETIFQRAISNAWMHGIKLRPGIENDGHGNCSYESVLLNINERNSFQEKLNMSPDFYRRIWNTDLMNKILDERIPWNPGLTKTQIKEGFQELMVSGVYERSFFGDMMMASIACGARKLILIFNTHEMTPHDPVSVIDPCQYGGICDTEIPIVLAYNLVHFESLHPIGQHDIEATVKLTKSYIAKPSRYKEEYGFTRNDMQYLVSQSIEQGNNSKTQGPENPKIKVPSAQKILHPPQDTLLRNQQQKGVPSTSQQQQETTEDNKRSFKFLNLDFQEMENGRIKCAICQTECGRLVTHLNHSKECSQYIDLEKFKIEFTQYRATQRKKKNREIQRAENPVGFRNKVNEQKRNQEARQIAEDPEGFRNKVNEKKRKQEARQIAEDPE